MAGFLLPRMVDMTFPRAEGLRTIEFGDPGQMRQRLIDFVIKGNKRATAGLLKSDYEAEGEQIEFVGERLAVINNDESVAAIVEVTRCEVLRFVDVPDEFALAEAEGDLSAEDFRKSHYEYWTSCGEVITDDTQVVTCYFDLIEVR
jgi:uncharacterized protein YhfF